MIVSVEFSNLQISVILAKEWSVGSWKQCWKVGNNVE